MRKVDHHLALCRVDDRDVARKVAGAVLFTIDAPDNNARHHRHDVVRPPALISKWKTWCYIALLNFCFGPMTFHWDKAAACLAPTFQRTPFFDDFALDPDEPVAVQITVIGLLESKVPSSWAGRASFNVLARVDRVLKGPLDGETIKIVAPGSSCDQGFVIGSSGTVVGKLVLNENGTTELHVIAQPIMERLKRQRLREQR